MSERYRIPIEQKRIDKGEMRIKKRLLSLGFTVGRNTSIPESYIYNVLPVNDSKAPQNLINILNTLNILKEWDEGAVGIIAGVGLGYTKLQDATPDNSQIYDFGGWEYLFSLGKKQNISDTEIKKAVTQIALDPTNSPAQHKLSTLLKATSIPDWIDKEKSTTIELLAASYATSNKETVSRKIKEYEKKKGTSDIRQVASIRKSGTEIAIEFPFKPLKWPWKWLIPILKAVSTVEIYHEIAHKMTLGVIDEQNGIYKSGLIRNTKEEYGVYEVVKKILDEKPKEMPKDKVQPSLEEDAVTSHH